jgi:hypothetical protein
VANVFKLLLIVVDLIDRDMLAGGMAHQSAVRIFIRFRGAVKLDIDLNKVTVNQCSDSSDAFADTHRCSSSTHVSSSSSTSSIVSYYSKLSS